MTKPLNEIGFKANARGSLPYVVFTFVLVILAVLIKAYVFAAIMAITIPLIPFFQHASKEMASFVGWVQRNRSDATPQERGMQK